MFSSRQIPLFTKGHEFEQSVGTRFHNESLFRTDEWDGGLAPCRLHQGRKLEFYARDCMRLADQPDVPPELREQLMQMAREWMKAMMEAEDESN
jgi:hypothetical protein